MMYSLPKALAEEAVVGLWSQGQHLVLSIHVATVNQAYPRGDA